MERLLALTGIAGMSFVIGLSGAVMPGPLLVVTIAEATRRGFSSGPLIVLGHMLLELALVIALVVGLAGYLQRPAVTATVGFVGGAIMCWMGQGMLRGARTATMQEGQTTQRGLHPTLSGIFVSLSNPYWTLWWATIGLGYLAMGLRFGIGGVVAFFTGHILADLTWYLLVSFGAAKGRRLIPKRAYRKLIAVCGILVFAFGIWFLALGCREAGRLVR
ncbi:MAG: LysE family transporter [Kiritimatiellia bacterium]